MLNRGKVLAYPTEAVWGLGCDPLDANAVATILQLKQRPWHKGLILVASSWAQLQPYCIEVTPKQKQQLLATWPGAYTWLIPINPNTPDWLTGQHDSIAVRVSDHPTVQALCQAFGGAIVSTSANPAGKEPARNAFTARRYFGSQVDILNAATGNNRRPSQICDLLSGHIIR